MREQWTDVVGFEGKYHVSTMGRIYSTPRVIIRGQGIRQPVGGKYLKTQDRRVRGNVYQIVRLADGKNGRYEYVHRVVAKAFIPNPNNLREVNHIDLDKTNNRADNLEWKSSAGNKRHAVRNGVLFNPRPLKGEETPSSKLTEPEVNKIRRLFDKGWTAKRLAGRFKVTPENIRYIIRRITWKHV